MECVSVVNLDTGVMTDITGPECIPEGLQGKNKLTKIRSMSSVHSKVCMVYLNNE